MDFKNLFFSMEGRINRGKFWLGILILFIAQWVVMLIVGALTGTGMMMAMDPNAPPDPAAIMAAMAPLFIVMLIFLWPALCIYAKRWHDRNKSGWWTLIILVPIVGSIWMIIELGLLKGTEGPNKYGPDPLQQG